jgi:hypothetical protein
MLVRIFFCYFLFLIQIFAQGNLQIQPGLPDSIGLELKIKPAQIISSSNTLSSIETKHSVLKSSLFKLKPVNAEIDSSLSYDNEPMPKWYSMVTNLPSDMLTFYHQEFTKDNIPKYLGIAVLTAGLIMTDESTWRESERFYNRTPFNKSFSDFFTEMGDGRTQFGLAAVFGAYGFIAKDNRAVRTASQIVEAVLASGAVVQVIKHLTGRESPFVETRAGGAWRFFPNQIEYHKHVPAYDAYPSGHICTSMAAFIVISENYPEIKWLEPASFVLAGFIGFGMANKGIHWYSDYPLGVALGYIFGKIVAHPVYLTKPVSSDKKESLSIMPYFNGISKGLSFSYSF